eukprot:9486090-Pyramimonas_sp.AAC.1
MSFTHGPTSSRATRLYSMWLNWTSSVARVHFAKYSHVLHMDFVKFKRNPGVIQVMSNVKPL